MCLCEDAYILALSFSPQLILEKCRFVCRRTWTITCRSGTPASRHPGSCTIRSVSTKSAYFRKAPDRTIAHANTTSLSLAHPLPTACCLSFSVFLCIAGRAYLRARREGMGKEPNHTTEKAWPSMNSLLLSGCAIFLSAPMWLCTRAAYLYRHLSKPSPPSQHMLHNYTCLSSL